MDNVNQVIGSLFIFRTYIRTHRGADLIVEEISPLYMSYYTYPHLRLLLKLSQFELAEEFGSFRRAPSLCIRR